jgi:hypothetical protein
MISVLSGFIDIPQFIKGIFMGSIGAILGARFLEPYIELILDGIKNNNGSIGRAYNYYFNSKLNHLIFWKIKSPHYSIKNAVWEYKVYNEGGVVRCYRSKIKLLEQNKFQRIKGEINRKIKDHPAYDAYFKGHFANDFKYLVWEERSKEGNNYRVQTTYYAIPKTEKEYLSGICIEKGKDEIINSLSIISSEEYGYKDLSDLYKRTNVEKYLDKLNIGYDNFDEESEEFIK